MGPTTTAIAFETYVSSWVPDDAIQLIWDVFFTSRNRGLSPEYHYPWIHDRSGLSCVRIAAGVGGTQTIAAALIVRYRPIGSGRQIGLIGLVCVAEQFRGRGLSARLLESAVELAKSKQLSHLVLWTTKADVYRSRGFEVDCADVFGLVTRRGRCMPRWKSRSEENAANIHSTVLQGAPAFAIQVVRYSSALGASISVCKSNQLETLVEYSGSMDAVIKLIDQVMPSIWNLNVLQHDPLIDALNRYGYDTDLRSSAVRMTLALGAGANQPDVIPFLERI
jgi:GNAT superfamily N-acetyltransferase